MPSIAADCAIARNAEAAQVNQGGLECSSYTWQVGRVTYGDKISACQENLDLTRPLQGRLGAMKLFFNNGLSSRGGAIAYLLPRNKEGETSE